MPKEKAPSHPNSTGPIKCFISYSHKDKSMCNKLKNHLDALSRLYNIETWFDGKILPGGNIDEEIKKSLISADIVLLLVTTDFLASYYCYEKELSVAMERHNKGQCIVVPIIGKPIVSGKYIFSHLKYVPTDGKPISTFSPQYNGFHNACEGISNLLKQFFQTKASDSETNTKQKHQSTTFSTTLAKKEKQNNIHFQIIKNANQRDIVIQQEMFDQIYKTINILPQFLDKIQEITNQQVLTLKVAVSQNMPKNTLTAFENNNFCSLLVQLFSYIQQSFVGIDKTYINVRIRNRDQYVSLVNIGYPAISLPTDPIPAKGGMIEAAIKWNQPVIKSFNQSLHKASHPNESIRRDYITMAFNDVSKKYQTDVSMCISIIDMTYTQTQKVLLPLIFIQLHSIVEELIISYFDQCHKVHASYRINDVLNWRTNNGY